MKLFDYKFLILFGLTSVIYFIYKELEYLRNKINKLETCILNNKIQLIPEPKIDTEISNFNLKSFNIPTFSIYPMNNSPKIITVDLTRNDIVVSESESSVSSKHVAIYSNDNDQNNDNSCSLLNDENNKNENEKNEIINNQDEREKLTKLTVDKLKKIAKDKNLVLTKENGKQKNKKELIDNILE